MNFRDILEKKLAEQVEHPPRSQDFAFENTAETPGWELPPFDFPRIKLGVSTPYKGQNKRRSPQKCAPPKKTPSIDMATLSPSEILAAQMLFALSGQGTPTDRITKSQLTKAHRTLVRRYHPDFVGHEQIGRFFEVQEYYEILESAFRRKQTS